MEGEGLPFCALGLCLANQSATNNTVELLYICFCALSGKLGQMVILSPLQQQQESVI